MATGATMNILLITLDQFRGDCLSCAGHPVVRTPNLDRLAQEGVRLSRHYSQAAPCGPGRASLYTGLYQMNHRVVANGTPLDDRFDNIARAARRAGYEPTLFGYTDQAIDPRRAEGSGDARLKTYEGVLPGFGVGLDLPFGDPAAWRDWLRDLGHDVADDARAPLAGEPGRPAGHSMAAFVTDTVVAWLDRQTGPWFAHVSHLRPHPPYAAAGRFATMYDPATTPPPVAPAADRHPLHEALLANPHMGAPVDEAELRRVQTQYYGMVSEVDAQLGRLWAALEARRLWDDTFVLVTADHGDQMGDHGLIQKGCYFEESYHIPAIIRDPRREAARGVVVDAFTEAVDVFPTLCEAMGIPVPFQCDGAPLTPFLRGETPAGWREAAYWEFDWRFPLIPRGAGSPAWDRRLEGRNLAVRRDARGAYVHFADGPALCFDLAADPTWRTEQADPAAVLTQAQAMLSWRARHADRTLTGMLIDGGPIGRWPAMPAHWEHPDLLEVERHGA